VAAPPRDAQAGPGRSHGRRRVRCPVRRGPRVPLLAICVDAADAVVLAQAAVGPPLGVIHRLLLGWLLTIAALLLTLAYLGRMTAAPTRAQT
jgi:hypothetical protein